MANMHLTCTNIEASKVDEALSTAMANGIRNIVALRGDAPAGQEKWEATEGGFNCALDLVKHIRSRFGGEFCISVAGYPEGHPDKISVVEGGVASLTASEKRRCSVSVGPDGKELVQVCRDADFTKELAYLKEKVDAGADFILTQAGFFLTLMRANSFWFTCVRFCLGSHERRALFLMLFALCLLGWFLVQMFFDTDVYLAFVEDCRRVGIMVPVVPGIMCLNSFGGFKKMAAMCKTRVPADLEAKMAAAQESTEAVKKVGIEFGAEMSRALTAGGAPGLHYYTLNLEVVTMGILDELGLRVKPDAKISELIKAHQGEKPWTAFEFFPPRTEVRRALFVARAFPLQGV